jgi:hypothetical protein
MIGLIAKFVNAVGGSDREDRQTDTRQAKINVMKIYVPRYIIMFVM